MFEMIICLLTAGLAFLLIKRGEKKEEEHYEKRKDSFTEDMRDLMDQRRY